MSRGKPPMLQPALFDLVNPPVKAPAVVEISSPTVKKGISVEERALCLELLGHDRIEVACSLCGEVYLLHTWHIRTCPMSPGGVGIDLQEEPKTSPLPTETRIPRAPASGLEIASPAKTSPLSQIGAPEEWIGRPVRCSVCGEMVPTYRHLDLVHGCINEHLRSRLLSAHLSTEHARGAEVLDLDVEQLRQLILSGGNPAREELLKRWAGGQRELSPNSDPQSLAGKHPYKGKGVADGASMAPAKWKGKKG